jgi:hypothetical protein
MISSIGIGDATGDIAGKIAGETRGHGLARRQSWWLTAVLIARPSDEARLRFLQSTVLIGQQSEPSVRCLAIFVGMICWLKRPYF